MNKNNIFKGVCYLCNKTKFIVRVDSTTIWDIDFKKWCELNDAVDSFWDKVEEVKNHG